MFDNFRNMDLKYKILVLASSTIAIIIMLSVLITILSNMLAPNNNSETTDSQPFPSQSSSPTVKPAPPTPSNSTIEEVPADDNTSDSDEMGIIYDVPLTSDEQVLLLQFAEKAFSELCTLNAGESYNQHFESVKSLFLEPNEYKNLIELYVKPSDSQKCLITGSNIIGYDPANGAYNVVILGLKTKSYNSVTSEDKLLMNMLIKFDSNEKMKVYAIQ
jgi:hypothetical protein